jgi:ankyrin repeat protein
MHRGRPCANTRVRHLLCAILLRSTPPPVHGVQVREDVGGPAVAELLLTRLAPPTLTLSLRETLSRDQGGVAPLHHLLHHGTAEALDDFLVKLSPSPFGSSSDETFFYESEKEYRQRYTNNADMTVWDVLVQEADGKPPLHWAIDRGPAATQRLLASMLQHGEQAGPAAFWSALTAVNLGTRMTCLNYALRSESIASAHKVFDLLEMLHPNEEGTRTLLLSSCRDGYTPLHRVLQSGDASLFKRVLWLKHTAALDPTEAQAWMTQRTRSGVGPLHSVLSSADPECIGRSGDLWE